MRASLLPREARDLNAGCAPDGRGIHPLAEFAVARPPAKRTAASSPAVGRGENCRPRGRGVDPNNARASQPAIKPQRCTE